MRHQLRAQRQPAMLLLVAAEVPGAKAVRQTQAAWLKERQRPSPVIASTVPDASPIKATIPATDRFSVQVVVMAPVLSRSDGCIGQTSPEFRKPLSRFV